MEGLNGWSYEERLQKCGFVSLELRKLRKDLALCYKLLMALLRLILNIFLKPGF